MEKNPSQDPLEMTLSEATATDRRRQKGRGTIALLRVTGGHHILDYRILRLGDSIEIGRDPLCSFCLSDGSVSRRHAGIVYRDGQFFLEDYVSRNGTYVNGCKVQSAVLAPGDRLEIGSVPLRLEWVTEQELAEHRQIVRQFETSGLDPLTGLFTRLFFEKYLPGLLERHRQRNQPITALFFDVDFFKSLNDRFGHAIGDVVLQTAARLLQSTVRRQDTCIRYGGEEIVVIMPGAESEEAEILANRYRIALQNHPWDQIRPLLAVTVSGGVAQWSPPETIMEWLGRADRALYEAKRDGRNRIVLSAAAAGR